MRWIKRICASSKPMPEAFTSTVVLLSKGLARYRYNFTEHFAAALPPEVRVIACPLGDQYWEVDFPALKAQHGRVEYRDFPRSMAELAAMRPTVLCTMEYPPQMLRPMFWAKQHGIPVVVFSDLGTHPPKQHQILWRTPLAAPVLRPFHRCAGRHGPGGAHTAWCTASSGLVRTAFRGHP